MYKTFHGAISPIQLIKEVIVRSSLELIGFFNLMRMSKSLKTFDNKDGNCPACENSARKRGIARQQEITRTLR